MRCALVNLHFGSGLAGINDALRGQARAAAATGTPLDIIVVNGEQECVEDGVRHVRYASRVARFGRIARLTKARLLASTPELQGYDLIFLRYPTAIDIEPMRFLRTAKARVVTVHHSNEVPELLSTASSAGTYARAALEWIQGRRVLREVDGIVGVTDEIRDYELARAGRALPATTIANGIDVSRIEPTGFVPFDGKELHLLFLVSAHTPWHGEDRLIAGLEAYRGERRILLDIVGDAGNVPAGTERRFGRVTIRYHGMLKRAELDRVFRGPTLAISSLALFRKGLRQACALKTREYLARGMPFVLGYEDVDVPADAPFAMRVPANDEPLSLDDVFAFAERVSALPDAAAMIRAHAERVLDWRVKVRAFETFAHTVMDSTR